MGTRLVKISILIFLAVIAFNYSGVEAQSTRMEYWFDEGEDSLTVNRGDMGLPYGHLRRGGGGEEEGPGEPGDGETFGPIWDPDTAFSYEGNQSLWFGGPEEDWVFFGRGDSNNIDLQNITVEAWIKPENKKDNIHSYVAWAGTEVVRFAFRVSSDGAGRWRLMGILYDPNESAYVMQSSPGTIDTSVWQHVALTYDLQSGGKLYIDGENVASMPSFGEMIDLYGNWTISASNLFAFRGEIDEVRVSDFPRIPGEGNGTGFELAWNTSLRDLAITAPVLVSPADSATDAPDSLTLEWEAVSESEGYQLQIASTPDFRSMILDSAVSETAVPVNGLMDDSTYYWRVGAKQNETLHSWSERRVFTVEKPTDVHDLPDGVPHEFKLAQNFPNPFNPVTTIQYSIPSLTTVEFIVSDVLGNIIHKSVYRDQSTGVHQIKYDGSELTSGIYFYKISTPDNRATGKMILLK